MADPSILATNPESTINPTLFFQPPNLLGGTPTAADKLAQYLIDTAVTSMANVLAASGDVIPASNQDQNTDPDGIIKKSLKEPAGVSRDEVIAAWTPPEMPTLPVLPDLPEGLAVDVESIIDKVQADIDALKDSWMAKYLPDDTDVSSLDKLFDDVLNGSNTATAKQDLDAFATQATNVCKTIRDVTSDALTTSATTNQQHLTANFQMALSGIASALAIAGDTSQEVVLANSRAQLLAALDAAVALSKANLSANVAAVDAAIAAQSGVAADNTQNIAWARARDQVAREAARQEREVVTSFASRGFSLPNGVMTSLTAKARANTLNSASDIAAQEATKVQIMFLEIFKEQISALLREMELQTRAENDNYKLVTDANLSYAKLVEEEAIKIQRLKFETAKEQITAYLRTMEAQSTAEIASYKSTLEGNLKFADLDVHIADANAERYVKNLGMTLDFTKFAAGEATRYRLGVIQGMNGLLSAYAQTVGTEIHYTDSIANAQKVGYAAIIDYYKAMLEQMGVGFKIEETNLDAKLKYIQQAATFIGQSAANHVHAAANTATVLASIVGHALSGVNTITSQAIQL